MRLVRAEVVPVALPFRETYRTAAGSLNSRSMAILRIRDDADGAEGLGEAVPLSLRGGPGLEQVVAELERCADALAGADAAPAATDDPAAVRAWITELLARCRQLGAGAGALCAVDCALHDLAGRLAGVPAWRLLGATEALPVPCNASIDAGDPETVEEAARAQRARGFGTFKVKVGTAGDAERVAAVRRGAGPDALIRVDANAAWDVETALARIADLDVAGLELVEQPCGDAEGLAAVRSGCLIPVVADESVATEADAERAVALGACDAATLKLSKVGGPRAALAIAAVVPSYLSSALDGPIGIAAAAHTAQALTPVMLGGHGPGLAHGLATLSMLAAAYAPCEGLEGPSIPAPAGPGLGVEIDERRLEELRIIP